MTAPPPGMTPTCDTAGVIGPIVNIIASFQCMEAIKLLKDRLGVTPLPTMDDAILAAISVGSVSMGANSYIGNAPNFMVRSIAEEAGTPMPSFFGYVFKYTLVFLLPGFAAVSWLFFRP